MKKNNFHLLTALLAATAAHAQVRTSEYYAITADTLDFGGQPATSENNFYSIQGSVTSITGISENSSPGQTTARHGYIGQLYDVFSYAGLIASNYYPDELGTTQLSMVRNMDDGTTLVAPPMEFTLSVLDGPISSISPAGLVTAGAVYEHTAATVAATSDLTGQLTLPLFVQDTLPDNFGIYAADGLPDTWQHQYFGPDNPLAAPLLDPDGDGQNNRFEYIAGIVPTNQLSRFLLRIDEVVGEANHRNIKFSPVLPDRTYTVKSSTTLGGGIWENLSDLTDDNQQPERTVTDRAASESRKFYQVEITKP